MRGNVYVSTKYKERDGNFLECVRPPKRIKSELQISNLSQFQYIVRILPIILSPFFYLVMNIIKKKADISQQEYIFKNTKPFSPTELNVFCVHNLTYISNKWIKTLDCLCHILMSMPEG